LGQEPFVKRRAVYSCYYHFYGMWLVKSLLALLSLFMLSGWLLDYVILYI